MPPNPKAKRNVQSKSTIQEDKPVASMIEKDGPIADSPLAIDLGEYPEGPSQDLEQGPSGMAPSEHKTPCERPHCKHCERGLGDYLANVLPSNDKPSSGPKTRPRTPRSSTQARN